MKGTVCSKATACTPRSAAPAAAPATHQSIQSSEDCVQECVDGVWSPSCRAEAVTGTISAMCGLLNPVWQRLECKGVSACWLCTVTQVIWRRCMPCSAAFYLVSASQPETAGSTGMACRVEWQPNLGWPRLVLLCQHIVVQSWQQCDLPRETPSTPWWYR